MLQESRALLWQLVSGARRFFLFSSRKTRTADRHNKPATGLHLQRLISNSSEDFQVHKQFFNGTLQVEKKEEKVQARG